MHARRTALTLGGAAATLVIVAGCTSGSDGNGTPSATETVTATDTVSSANPPTGSGVPATSSAPASGSSSSSNSGPGLCTPTVMTFDVTPGEGAAGSTYFEIRATNASESPCVTTGFPGVAFLDAGGKKILDAARDDPSKVTTITVAPGQQISAQVRAESTDTANGGGECPSSPKFLLTLPDNTDATTITHTTPACQVSVAAFIRGPGI